MDSKSNKQTILSNKPYTNVLMEIRPRLQSVNVFVNFAKTFESVDVILNPNNFVLKIDDVDYFINCSFNILTTSLSNVCKQPKCVSFRFCTENILKLSGSFTSELINSQGTLSLNKLEPVANASKPINYETDCLELNCTDSRMNPRVPGFSHDSKTNDTKPNSNINLIPSYINSNSVKFHKSSDSLNKESTFRIQCQNCLQNLSEYLNFNRILPLPSEGSNHNDWFCHAHGQSVPDLNPKVDDLFYSHCYCHINNLNLKGIKKSGNVLVCLRCLCWLGLTVNEKTHKVWFNTVGLQEFYKSNLDKKDFNTVFDLSCNGSNDLGLSNLSLDHQGIFKTDPLRDCFISINKLTQDKFVPSSKILLECQISKVDCNYLLLWVLEKNLLINWYEEDALKEETVSKVLFKFSAVESPLITTWKNDVGVVPLMVSKPMVTKLLLHLFKMNSFMPECFSKTQDFHISYIRVY